MMDNGWLRLGLLWMGTFIDNFFKAQVLSLVATILVIVLTFLQIVITYRKILLHTDNT